MKRAFVILLLSGFLSFMLAAVGKITAFEGDVSLKRNDSTLAITPGFPLEEKDKILTGKASKARLVFNDETTVNIGKDTEFDIQSYLFDEPNEKFSVGFGVQKGIFRSITGKIGKVAPDRFVVETKTVTMGIRGTDFSGVVSDAEQNFFVNEGAIYVESEGITVEIAAGFGTTVLPGEPPTPPQQVGAAFSQSVNEEVILSTDPSGLESNVPLSNLFNPIRADQELQQPPAFVRKVANNINQNRDEPSIQSPQVNFTDQVSESRNLPVDNEGNPISDSSGLTNSVTPATDGSSATYRGQLSITVDEGTNDFYQLFAESDELPEVGTELELSSLAGGSRILQSSDFLDSSGYSYTKWGTWNSDVTSDVATGLLYPNQNVYHHWVIGERTKVEPTGTGTYSGSVVGNILGSSSTLGGSITLNAAFGSNPTIGGSIDITQNGSAWVSGTIDSASVTTTSAGFYGFTNSISGSDVASGGLSGYFFGPNAQEAGGGWAISKTSGEAAQGAFIAVDPAR